LIVDVYEVIDIFQRKFVPGEVTKAFSDPDVVVMVFNTLDIKTPDIIRSILEGFYVEFSTHKTQE
jgi:hypothetical protein